ncbi:hypothetical protein SAMN05216282_10896 [Cryobacterium psychrotolerans]|uniref:Uncharacterized protein n=1 Tax=Cryobacterium psychrotolerans TaxID=386301 RepID=A0A1G9D736_9MICO|nr:hypothetical protein SAMN05216282_10896 [Cryobacterium psychrotolerans]
MPTLTTTLDNQQVSFLTGRQNDYFDETLR